MGSANITPAKITPPRVSAVLPRHSLWTLLEQASQPGLVWLQSPAGFGKTMGVAGWLALRPRQTVWYRTDSGDADPATVFGYLARVVPDAQLPVFTTDFQLGLAAFARRWFERWWSAVLARASVEQTESVLVFDDYQEAGEHGLHHELLACALEVMPAQARMIVMSRQAPPGAWARWQASGLVQLVQAQDVSLTESEALDLARLRSPTWSAEQVRRVAQACKGWAAGLVLLMQDGRSYWPDPQQQGPADSDFKPAQDLSQLAEQPERLQDYFLHEVIRRMPESTVEVLRWAAWMPVALVDVLHDLLPHHSVGAALESLHRSGTFTLKVDRTGRTADAYQFHPLFQSSLRSPGVQGQDAYLLRTRQREIAAAMERRGHLDEALSLAVSAGDWLQVAVWLRAAYPELAAQGRQRTVLRWLASVPESVMQSQPWLLFARGECRCLLLDPTGVPDLQAAAAQFEALQDHDGLAYSLHAWSLALISRPDANPGQLLPLFERLAVLSERWAGSPRARLWMLRALTTNRWFSHPGDPRLQGWMAEFRAVAEGSGSPQALALWLHADLLLTLAQGDHDRVKHDLVVLGEVIAQLREPNLLAFCRFLRIYALNKLGRYEESLQAFESGAAAAAQEGAMIWAYQISMHGVEACIGAGRLQQAQAVLEALCRQVPVERGFASIFNCLLSGWIAMARGDLDRALQECRLHEERLATADVALFRTLSAVSLGWVLLARGDLDEADGVLQRALASAKDLGSAVLQFDTLLAISELMHRRGHHAQCMEHLARALELGRRHRYVTVYYARPSDLAPIMARALEAGLEVEYVRHFIRARALPPPPSLPVQWCWPLRIRTLGEFTIEREIDGQVEPLRFGHKTPKKLLTLLKALIALGGPQVPEARLTDAVWPELDADQAQAALKVAISRLNALLGEPGGWVTQRGGIVALDADRIWLDTWALDRRLTALAVKEDSTTPQGDTEQALPLDITDLYRGPFLPADHDQPWSLSVRERWRHRLVATLLWQVKVHLKKQDTERALACCLEGFDRDPLSEPLALQAMQLQHQLGRRLEAVAVYERLKLALGRDLGLRPSAEANALHMTLIQG